MKKRGLVLPMVLLLTLVSCGKTNVKSTSKADKYEHITLNKGEADLLAAVDNVDDANVVLVASKPVSVLFPIERYYSTQSAVLYKHTGNKYYALSYYDSAIISNSSTFKYSIMLDESTSYDAHLYKYDTLNSLCIFEIETTASLTTANLKNEAVEAGEMVFTISSSKKTSMTSMNDYSYDKNTNLLYTGIISRTGRIECTHTAMYSEKDYGSGLFDYDGNLIGINIGKMSTALTSDRVYGMNYAVYGTSLCKLVSDMENSVLISAQHVSAGGISGKVYFAADQEEFPAGINCGYYVAAGGSTFTKLKTGDLIAFINDTPVYSDEVIAGECHLTLASEKVKLIVYRQSGNSYTRLEITN